MALLQTCRPEGCALEALLYVKGKEIRSICSFFKKKYVFIYLFIYRSKGREKERKRNINVRDIDRLLPVHACDWGQMCLDWELNQ